MWNQVTGDRLVEVVAVHLDVRIGPPPAKAKEYSTVLLEFLAMGFGGIGETNKYLLEQFTILFSLLNGFFWESKLVHYCVGRSCCSGGVTDTAANIVAAVPYSRLREKPTIPEKSRWSKGVASLEFWVVAMSMYRLILLLVEAPREVEPWYWPRRDVRGTDQTGSRGHRPTVVHGFFGDVPCTARQEIEHHVRCIIKRFHACDVVVAIHILERAPVCEPIPRCIFEECPHQSSEKGARQTVPSL